MEPSVTDPDSWYYRLESRAKVGVPVDTKPFGRLRFDKMVRLNGINGILETSKPIIR